MNTGRISEKAATGTRDRGSNKCTLKIRTSSDGLVILSGGLNSVCVYVCVCVSVCVCVCVCVSLSHVQLFATSWTVARQAPLSLGFSRKENWSGLSFPYPGDLPNPGIEPRSPSLQVDSLPSEPTGKSRMLWSSLNHCLTVLLSIILALTVQRLPPRDSSSESFWFKLRGEKTFF